MQGPDPSTTTRQAFTDFFLSQQCPESAVLKYKHVWETHQNLMRLFIEHPAMAQNKEQTYMTPAASKNKVYFMWDFIGRSLGMLSAVDPQTPRSPMWTEVLGRAALAKSLIMDTTGKLENMNRGVGYHDDADVEFTPEIKEEAGKLDQLPRGN